MSSHTSVFLPHFYDNSSNNPSRINLHILWLGNPINFFYNSKQKDKCQLVRSPNKISGIISYFLYFSQKTKKFIPKAVVYGAWRWKTHTASFLASWTPLCIAVASIWTSPWPSTSSPLSFTPIKEDGVACANRKARKFSSSLCSLQDGLHEQNFGRGAAKLCE